jgi:hypothetical protein
MWEVKAHPEGFADLLDWVCVAGVPALEVNPLHIGSEVYSSTDQRVVVISKWRSNPEPIGDPPRHLVARKPQFWDFTPVDR